MSITLYRKYRPQKFSDLVGQNHIKITLQNEIKMGKLAHAFIFTGPRGVGKTTTARILAKTINCLDNEKNPTEPCNVCSSCEEITTGRAFDVIEIDAASHTGVDNVRENIITTAKINPARLKYRVFIIDEVHMLSISAFNALLKILEEPPKNVIFILATTEIHKVPLTIISRCQRFDFRKVSLKDIIEVLSAVADKEQIKIDRKVLENIARASAGSIRDAESTLGQILALGEKEISLAEADIVLPRSDFNLVLELLNHLSKKETPLAIAFINRIVFEGVNLNQFTTDLIEILRKALLQKIGNNLEQFSIELDENLEKEIINFNQNLNIPDIIMMIEVLSKRKMEIRYSEIIQLPLELAAVEIIENISGKSNIIIDEKQERGEKKETELIEDLKKNEKKQDTGSLLSLADIKNKWQLFLEQIKSANHTLCSFLKNCQIISYQNDLLELGFQYKFHLETIKELKNRRLIEETLKKIFNHDIEVKAELVKTEESGFLKNLVESFGGEIVK